MILAFLGFWVWRLYSSAVGLFGALVGFIAISVVAELGLELIDLPVFLWGLLTIAVMSVTSCIDVVVFAKHVGARKNRISIAVFILNLAIAGMALWHVSRLAR